MYDPVLTPALAVFGAAGQLHRETGAECGVAGFPTSDEHNCWPSSLGTRCQRFEHGLIRWTASGGARYLP